MTFLNVKNAKFRSKITIFTPNYDQLVQFSNVIPQFYSDSVKKQFLLPNSRGSLSVLPAPFERYTTSEVY